MQRHREAKFKAVAVAVAAATAFFTAGFPAKAQSGSLPAVRTIVIQTPTDVATRQFFGRIRARETVDLSFQVGGTMTWAEARFSETA